MAFTLKELETKEKETNCFRVDIRLMHGDADFFENITIGPFLKEQEVELYYIQKAIQDMLQHDKDSNNRQAYETLPMFLHFLEKHWRYDKFARECGFDRFCTPTEHRFIYTDENGKEHLVENFTLEDQPLYTYIKLHNTERFSGFIEGDIITSYFKIDESLLSREGFVLLENPEELYVNFSFEKETPELDEDSGIFTVMIHEQLLLEGEDVEIEEKFYDYIDTLQA